MYVCIFWGLIFARNNKQRSGVFFRVYGPMELQESSLTLLSSRDERRQTMHGAMSVKKLRQSYMCEI